MTKLEPASAAPNVLLGLSAQIVCAYVGNNQLPMTEVPNLIRNVYAAIAGLPGQGADAVKAVDRAQKPAVPVKQSVTPDHIICLEDGKRLKMLKRYLRSHYDMSPEQYRAKWGLPGNYPMAAPNYAKQRSDFAKSIGLGRTASTPPPKTKRTTKAGPAEVRTN